MCAPAGDCTRLHERYTSRLEPCDMPILWQVLNASTAAVAPDSDIRAMQELLDLPWLPCRPVTRTA